MRLLKTEKDGGLQQPAVGESGLFKPLFWVDLEMTGGALEGTLSTWSCPY